MRFSSAFFAATVVLPVFGAPTLVPIIKRGGTLKENSYIITLKDGVTQASFVESLKKGFTQPDSAVIHTYQVINGFSVNLSPSDLAYVRGMNQVASIEQDQILSLPDHEMQDLSPISGGQPTPSTGSPSHNGGEGVTVYGLDTGIYIEHECFEGRARWGWAAPPMVMVDGHGHGTHTAGTAIGKGFGVATKARMIGVKVMNDAGTGSTSDIIAGINYACNDFKNSGKPSIVTMSLGGGINGPLDDAVNGCIGWGMHFTVAAGNDNKDAKDVSPARMEKAITVGAVDDKHVKAPFSNFGPIVDIQAPGVKIVSAGHIGKTSQKTASGTSMATPYVAGVVAVALSQHGQMSPADLSYALKKNAKADCTGMPDGTTNLRATIW